MISLNKYVQYVRAHLLHTVQYLHELDTPVEGNDTEVIVSSIARTRSLGFSLAGHPQGYDRVCDDIASLPTPFLNVLSEAHRVALAQMCIEYTLDFSDIVSSLSKIAALCITHDPMSNYQTTVDGDVVSYSELTTLAQRGAARKKFTQSFITEDFLLPFYAASLIRIKPSEVVDATPSLR